MTESTSQLIGRLDIDSALAEELEQFSDLLPKQVVDQALEESSSGVAEYIRQLAVADVPVQPAAKVIALKWRHGRRTVAALPLYERVLYRAVVRSLAEDLEPRVRGTEEYEAFQTAPMEHEDARYVVMTDLANYYASIDIARLSEEVLRRTGQWAQVEWLTHFWQVTSDGLGGIPQMNTASDIVGDSFADLLHRRLLRKGLAIWRYADDFRIACSTYGGCVEALEALDEAARELGLVINERKTLTPGIEKYREIVEGPARRLARINEEVEADLTQTNPYDWETVTPEDAEVMEASAQRAIDIWAEEHQSENDLEDRTDMTSVLPQSLLILGVLGNPESLEHVSTLLRYEPQLTPVIGRYMRWIAELPENENRAARTLESCLNGLTLTKWQRLWLLNVAEELGGTPGADRSWIIDWMEDEVDDDLEPLSCQAVWSLARHRKLYSEEWARLDQGSRYAAPFAAASLHGVINLDNNARSKLIPTGRIEERVSQWSASTHFAPAS